MQRYSKSSQEWSRNDASSQRDICHLHLTTIFVGHFMISQSPLYQMTSIFFWLVLVLFLCCMPWLDDLESSVAHPRVPTPRFHDQKCLDLLDRNNSYFPRISLVRRGKYISYLSYHAMDDNCLESVCVREWPSWLAFKGRTYIRRYTLKPCGTVAIKIYRGHGPAPPTTMISTIHTHYARHRRGGINIHEHGYFQIRGRRLVDEQ